MRSIIDIKRILFFLVFVLPCISVRGDVWLGVESADIDLGAGHSSYYAIQGKVKFPNFRTRPDFFTDSGAGEPNETRTINYTYDALNRLTVEDACETGSGNGYGYTGQYVYDLVGNRRSRNVSVTYYQDQGNPVREQRISTSYSYYSDDNGETDRLHTESHSITQISLVMPDEQIYLYASNGGEFHYTRGLNGKRLSQVHAMLLGLPTKLGSCLFYIALVMVPLAFISPFFAGVYVRMRKRQSRCVIRLSLYHRCVLVFLAYALLIGPFGFEQLSHADIQYQDLLASDWGTDGEIITYTYDRNGSVATKVVNDGGPEVTYTNEYNLRNRLAKLTKTTSGQSSEHVTEYKYNPSGIRVCAYSYDTTDAGQTKSNEKTIDYLIDAYNHTGYAQTLAEDDGTNKTTYIIGSDVLAQATNSNNPEYLLYDGHGSTRQLLASNGSTISDSFSYDSYGVMLGGNPQTPAGTNLLYAGEHFDTAAQNYYLRARLYNQNNGRFNRADPYPGNTQDPQSLHKYLYAHCNPVNNIDPSGELTIGSLTISGLQLGIAIAAGLTIIGLTIFNGIRNQASTLAIAWQVAQNLAAMVAIVGVFACGGLIAILASGTLFLSFVVGFINLARSWPDMDTTDKIVAGVSFLMFLAFVGAVRSAAVQQPQPFRQGASTRLPEGYYSDVVVDMRGAGNISTTTALGWVRSVRYFWREFRTVRPEALSSNNQALIQSGRSPIVDTQWIRYYPQHGSFVGETLVHHHMGQGPYATAVPMTIHRSWNIVIHPYRGDR